MIWMCSHCQDFFKGSQGIMMDRNGPMFVCFKCMKDFEENESWVKSKLYKKIKKEGKNEKT